MADIRSKLNELYSLEQLAAGRTALHRLHPLSKMAVTAVYLLCVASFDRGAVVRLLPYLFYPALVLSLAEIPYRMIARRAWVALPFCLFAGVSNLLLDRRVGAVVLGVPLSAGLLSLCSLLLRTLLCVSAVLILVAVTPFSALTGQLRRLGVPGLVVSLLEMTYRYIGVLAGEAAAMVTAYRLRGNGARWPALRYFGPFVGQLLLRSADRAERVYQAMQCRLYGRRDARRAQAPFAAADWLFLLAGCGSCLLFRFFDLPAWLGGLLL